MTDPLDRPLHGFAVYNPDLLSKQELLDQFIARRPLLDRLVEDLRPDRPQHKLLLGARGMGKTTLLRRLRYAIDDDPSLSQRWLPLVFPEEQYNVVRLSDLYLNCLDALGDALEQRGFKEDAIRLDLIIQLLSVSRQEEEIAQEVLARLLQEAEGLGKGLVLLIDNVDRILDGLKEPDEWKLRELLSHEPRLLLIGASAQATEASYDYGKAFYEFFYAHELTGIPLQETRDVLRQLARLANTPQVEKWLDDDPARLRTLHTLAGGNPRTIVLLYRLVVEGTDGGVLSDLQRLLDLCTPLYKARFEELPPQAQQILDALALHWDPMTVAELAGEVRLEVSVVSSQLTRLAKQGVVEKVASYGTSKLSYQVAERFFNIWYLMRASRRVRSRLVWLVEFLKLFYSQEELEGQAQRYLQSSTLEVVYVCALFQALSKPALRRALLGRLQNSQVTDDELRHLIAGLEEGEDPRALALLDVEEILSEVRFVVEFLELVADSRSDEAERFVHAAITRNPGNGVAWYCLGMVLWINLGRLSEAEQAFRTAIRFYPYSSILRLPIAMVLAQGGNWAEAASHARQFLIDTPPQGEELRWPGIVPFFREAVRAGHTKDAIRLLEEAGLTEKWRPLTEALRAAAEGTSEYLRRVAPEVREPAEKIYADLTGQQTEGHGR